MAEQLGITDQSATIPLSNSAARHEAIRRTMRQISELEAKRKSINAEMREVKNKLVKGELGLKLADWALLQRLYDSEQEQRDETMDCLREGFAALGIHQTLDWVSTVEAAQQKEAGTTDDSEGKGSAEVANFNQGRQAGLRGETGSNNPWPQGVRAHETWERGWVAGQSELAAGLAQEGGPVEGAGQEEGEGEGEAEAPAKRGRGRPRGSHKKATADLLN